MFLLSFQIIPSEMRRVQLQTSDVGTLDRDRAFSATKVYQQILFKRLLTGNMP